MKRQSSSSTDATRTVGVPPTLAYVRAILTVDPPDIQICFDYFGLGAVADAPAFVESFRNVTFDSVLQYVAFPPVKVENLSIDQLRSDEPGWSDISESIKSDAAGRADLFFFFHWLKVEKKVQRILRVIVEDSVSSPHSDAVIELALKPFGVEILDWSKLDIDPETIYHFGQELRELYLHWGGSNAVLCGWAAPDGLRKLPSLSTIHLSVDHVSNACTVPHRVRC